MTTDDASAAAGNQPTLTAVSHKPGVKPTPTCRLGCVSFLNSKPLIDGWPDTDDVPVRYHVPSALLPELESGAVDLALCPIIDYQRSRVPLVLVPVGGIGCDGPTLTVRLLSQVPPQDITLVHTDPDSHTSVALMLVWLHERYGLRPQIQPLEHAQSQRSGAPLVGGSGRANGARSTCAETVPPATVLLIGDKVVTQRPDPALYPYDIDLGQAWKELTGLPFVFAMWMTREGTDLGDTPRRLARLREHNQPRLSQIVARYAKPLGWPEDLATEYLGHRLRYDIGPRQLQAVRRFWDLAHGLGLTPTPQSWRCLTV